MSATTAERTTTRKGIPGFAQLQRLGKSLMLPIALLPAAGILLRLGQEDLLGQIDAPVIGPFFDAMSAAGGAIFDNLPLLFAVGVAIGMAKKADGSTALSAVAGFLVMSSVFKSMSPVVLEGQTNQVGDQLMINYGVFAGIIVGLVTAWLFDRYHTIQLPTYLGFFGGRRFVPIVVSFATLFLGFALAYFYPVFNAGLTSVGQFIGGAGALGAFAYGFVNRMLIPLGLHHIVNTYIWFLYGDYNNAGTIVTGELARFAAGDPAGGHLTSGFYPILMFGLPGAALAMLHCARPGQKKVAGGILVAAGLTAFLTGITEPLEFAFMFVAFPLYVIHALLTGLSLAIAYALDIHLGFSFSAGLVDLLLYGGAPAAKNIPLLIGMGVAFFVLYYVLFRFAITAWNMRTPGREPDSDLAGDSGAESQLTLMGADRAKRVIAAFGGAGNLSHVDACISRLRIEVNDKALVDKARLQALGAAGVLEVGNNVQAVFGTQSDALKDDINRVLAGGGVATATDTTDTSTDSAAPEIRTAAEPRTGKHRAPSAPVDVAAPLRGRAVALSEVPDETFARGLVGAGIGIDPPREVIDVVAPVSGKLVQMFPHAFAILTEDKTGVLVHLGIDTVKLSGKGFTTHAAKGDLVDAGQTLVTYDVPAVEAEGRNPMVMVVATDTKSDRVSLDAGSGDDVRVGQKLFTVTG
ncbi:MAG: glucose PTS transporter subunit IIA [Dermatophilus congolensis]|nr:glucose PTS transporter subunit IIA [Dermatophilus congolensis]